MFIGHFGLGLAAKKVAPSVSLGTLFIAVQFLDLLWPTLLLFNVEHVVIHPELGGERMLEFTDYPVSHSLLMAMVWSVAFGGIYFLVKKNMRDSVIVGLAVLSHWVLDLIVHFHDLPIFPWASPKVGLEVWANPVLTNLIEGFMFITGIVIYLRAARPRKGVFWALMALLLLVQVSNLFSPAPGSVTALAWSAQVMWLLVGMAYWADRPLSSSSPLSPVLA